MGRIKSRKLWVTVLTGLLVAVNDRLGLGLSQEALLGLVALAVAYLAAQGWVDGRAEARGTVENT